MPQEFKPVKGVIYKLILELAKDNTLRFKIIRKAPRRLDEVTIIRQPQINWMNKTAIAIKESKGTELHYEKTQDTMQGVYVSERILELINPNNKFYKTAIKLVENSRK
jgi:hypothetical protein